MSQISQQVSRIQIGALQVAITVCTLAIASAHLYLAIMPDKDFRFWSLLIHFWFLLDGLGYLALLSAFFRPRYTSKHHKISFLLTGYALLTIILWFLLGQPYSLVISIINAVELMLAVLAFYEGWRVLRLGPPHFIEPQSLM